MTTRPRPFPHIDHVIGARPLPADLRASPGQRRPDRLLPARSGILSSRGVLLIRHGTCAAGAALGRTSGDFLQFYAGGLQLGGQTTRESAYSYPVRWVRRLPHIQQHEGIHDQEVGAVFQGVGNEHAR